ncbi:aldehyde dehydrogenase family protein [Ottowia thiooxydans]|uniref:aldehyde dehydrogenase family protein n=1 Tax=Ottowia thiooxydans TaxID=219182 RepID=UPI0003FE64B4|nr:aldehyde dehydrogenase family protein [Ottowia thiooxydans]
MQTFLNTVNGQPVAAGKTFDSLNPATGEVIAKVAYSTREEVDQAIATAHKAQPAWAALTDAQRRAYLVKIADAIKAHAEPLAEWVTREQGKPLGGDGRGSVPGSRFELMGCEGWTRATAAIDVPVEVVFENEQRRDEVHRQPYGVVAAIAPWNWPLLIAMWQIVPSLRMGNTVVIKPSEYTSACSLELFRLIAEVLPPGVLNTVSGFGDVGGWLSDDARIGKIMFTGSASTGSKVAAAAARNLTPTTLELGGNDAAIVLADADPESIAMGLFWGAFLNMGQTCACVKRLYVPASLHDQIVSALAKLASAMPMGDGMLPGTAMGPIQNRMQFDKVTKLVEAARSAGATIVCGGQPSEGPGNFYPLTLVTDIDDGNPLVDEEQFGPVLPIIRYTDVDDVVARANRLDVGLGASVWSRDAEKARAVAMRLQAGTVWINQHGVIHPLVPFGGSKRSGWGVEFGVEGLKSVTRPHVISMQKS